MERRGVQAQGQVVDLLFQVTGQTVAEVAAAAWCFVLNLSRTRAWHQQGLGNVAVLVQPIGLIEGKTSRSAILAVVLDEVDIGRCRQIGCVLIVQRVVKLTERRAEPVDAPAVECNVVGVNHAVEALCFELEQMYTEQRFAIEPERTLKLTLHPVFGSLKRIVLPLQVNRCHRHRHARGEGLQRHALLVTLVEQDHAQGVVFCNQQVHGPLEQFVIEGAVDLQMAADVV